MATTKIQAVAKYFKLPMWNCRLSKENPNIVICDDMEFWVLSEFRGIRRASYLWVESNAWRYPLDFILRHTVDIHRGFNGIYDEKLIAGLQSLQDSLGANFNELIFSMITNKTAFYEDAVREYGHKFMWQPIDGQEVIVNGFRIYRIK